MNTLRKALSFCFLAALVFWVFQSPRGPIRNLGTPPAVFAQSNPPDCGFSFAFTGNATQNGQNNSSTGSTPCVNWRVTFTTTASLTATVTFQTAPDNASWTSVPNTLCSSTVQPPCILQGANPSTGQQGMAYISAYANWVRVIVTSASGTGTGTVRVYGAKGASASGGGNGIGGGGGGGTPGGSSGQFQYNNSGAFAGQTPINAAETLQSANSCMEGTVAYNNATLASAGTTVALGPIVTGLTGGVDLSSGNLLETAQFTGVSSVTVSMGTSAGSYVDVLPTFNMGIAGGQNHWFDHPANPIQGAGNTSNIYLYFTGATALSNLSAGNLAWRLCGYPI